MSTRARRSWMLSTLLMATLPCWQALADPAYTVVDIGVTDPFTDSFAIGINDAGVVVGYLTPNDQAYEFTVGGGFVLLDYLAGGSLSTAFDINATGVAVGRSTVSGGQMHAAIWPTPTGELQLDGPVSPVTNFDSAFAVNAAGQAAGSAQFIGIPYVTRAMYWSETGTPTDLSVELGADGAARDINDNGQVVGFFATAVAQQNKAFVWTAQSGVQELVGLQGAVRSEAYGIGSTGVAVGTSGAVDSPSNAVRWTDPLTPQDLGALPGSARNTGRAVLGGTVVGISEFGSPTTSTRAFVWKSATGIQDLNDVSDAGTIGMTLENAMAINASGQIVGTGKVGTDEHGFIATPTPEAADTWPALVALAWLGRRRLARRA